MWSLALLPAAWEENKISDRGKIALGEPPSGTSAKQHALKTLAALKLSAAQVKAAAEIKGLGAAG